MDHSLGVCNTASSEHHSKWPNMARGACLRRWRAPKSTAPHRMISLATGKTRHSTFPPLCAARPMRVSSLCCKCRLRLHPRYLRSTDSTWKTFWSSLRAGINSLVRHRTTRPPETWEASSLPRNHPTQGSAPYVLAPQVSLLSYSPRSRTKEPSTSSTVATDYQDAAPKVTSHHLYPYHKHSINIYLIYLYMYIYQVLYKCILSFIK